MLDFNQAIRDFFGSPDAPAPTPPAEAGVALMNKIINRYHPLVSAECPLSWQRTVRNKATGKQHTVTVTLKEDV